MQISPTSSMSDYYNDVGIVNDSSPLSGGGFDGSGSSYSAQALAAAGLTPGATITHSGLTFTWPTAPAGQPDNVITAGQTILATGSGTTLGFLGATANGSASGTGTITYTDGTTQSATLGFTDWTSGSPSFGNGTAAAMPYRNSASGTSQRIGTKVFTTNIALQPGKAVASVTLPSRANQGQLHVFALGTDKGPLTTGG
jgi:hypothetical protein